MRTDSLFYEFSASRPDQLARLVGLDPSVGWQFESVNVKRLERQIDGMLFCALAPTGPNFVEFQGYHDPHFYWRVFNEVTAFWMTRKPHELADKSFRIFVLFVDEAHDPGNDALQPIPPHSIVRMTLKQALARLPEPGLLSVLEPLTVPDVETLHARIPYYRDQLQQLHLPESERTVLQGLLVQAILTRFPSLNREEVRTMITLTPLRETRVFQEFGQEFLEEGIQKGIQQGIQQGVQQGKLESTKASLFKFWSLRFGPPVEWVHFRLHACQTLELLEALQDKLFLSTTVEEAQAHVKGLLGNGT